VYEDTGGDVLMEAPGAFWSEVAREPRPAGNGHPAHDFVTLKKSG